ncbi:MAG: ABC transporter permease [Treponema sp.]
MNGILACNLALRYLGITGSKSISNARKSLYGAVAGIGISIIPLVVVLVISDGMIQGISTRLIELGSGHIQLIDLRSIPHTKHTAEQQQKTAELFFESIRESGISGSTGMKLQKEGAGMLIGKKGRSGGTIRAVEPDYFSSNPAAAALLTVTAGSLSLEEPNSVLLGKKIAETTGLSVGDMCSILTLLPAYKQDKTVPKVTRFKVTGIISSGYQELDALWIMMPLETGKKILSPQSSLFSLSIRTENPFDTALLQHITDTIQRRIPHGFVIYTWKELNRSQFYAFQTTRNLLMFIMFLIVLVAAANISSAMIMLIMERRKEIAILKAAGTHPFFITLSFLCAGLLTAVLGSIIGLSIGIVIALHINEIFLFLEYCINTIQPVIYRIFYSGGTPLEIHLLDPQYYLEYIPVRLSFTDLYIVVAGALILSLIVCMIPAIYAGKEKPLDSMRKI